MMNTVQSVYNNALPQSSFALKPNITFFKRSKAEENNLLLKQNESIIAHETNGQKKKSKRRRRKGKNQKKPKQDNSKEKAKPTTKEDKKDEEQKSEILISSKKEQIIITNEDIEAKNEADFGGSDEDFENVLMSFKSNLDKNCKKKVTNEKNKQYKIKPNISSEWIKSLILI